MKIYYSFVYLKNRQSGLVKLVLLIDRTSFVTGVRAKFDRLVAKVDEVNVKNPIR